MAFGVIFLHNKLDKTYQAGNFSPKKNIFYQQQQGHCRKYFENKQLSDNQIKHDHENL
jgi:hypothetical protein